MPIRVKRVYDPVEPDDGARYLVERLWPRGMTREALQLTAWVRDIAPSDALRRWYGHDPVKWPEFRERYRAELAQKPDLWCPLLEQARVSTITLLYSTRERQRNSAVVLAEFLTEQLQRE